MKSMKEVNWNNDMGLGLNRKVPQQYEWPTKSSIQRGNCSDSVEHIQKQGHNIKFVKCDSPLEGSTITTHYWQCLIIGSVSLCKTIILIIL
jgi:hypothetical protein